MISTCHMILSMYCNIIFMCISPFALFISYCCYLPQQLLSAKLRHFFLHCIQAYFCNHSMKATTYPNADLPPPPPKPPGDFFAPPPPNAPIPSAVDFSCLCPFITLLCFGCRIFSLCDICCCLMPGILVLGSGEITGKLFTV